ncbi:DUF2164 domain-containing protein [Haloferula sp. BvORR071]|uniref:DUF2164 domain-containing protein n=1 Tax=Haloferula sp. BvORR071 TaxID=1396141 RepID=UPI0005525196|nr:DUF2164 domain-containing protein [Haloferula sp. BvORR071]
MPLKLSKDQRRQAAQSLERYLKEELDLEVSELQAGFLLDFFQTEIAPIAYNQGVGDARRFLEEKMEDLGGVCFEHEMTFWDSGKKKL